MYRLLTPRHLSTRSVRLFSQRSSNVVVIFFSLESTVVITPTQLDKILTKLKLPASSSFNAEKTAEEILRNLSPRVAGTSNEVPVAKFVAGLLNVFPYSHGPPLVEEVLAQVRHSHPALNHPYLNRLSGVGSAPPLPNPRAAIVDFAHNYAIYNASFCNLINGAIAKLHSPSHVSALRHDLSEENGHLDEDDVAALASAGVKREWVDEIPHKTLFRNFVEKVKESASEGQRAVVPNNVKPGEQFLSTISNTILGDSSEAFVIGALSVGTEAIVQYLFEPITLGIKTSFPELSLEDYVFFPLHTIVDENHAETLLNIAKDVISREPKTSEVEFLHGAMAALDARAILWDQLLARALSMPNVTQENISGIQTYKEGLQTSQLYNRQASNWVRKKPTCLSDFTARPRLLEMVAPLEGKDVLDVGCGEGYLTRLMREKYGAATVFGVDISSEMINAAREEERKSPLKGITYAVGNATALLNTIRQAGPGCIPDFLLASDISDVVDSAIACFLFNYMSVLDMETVMTQVYQALKPGGHFVFSVPHPCFPFWKTGSEEMPFRWEALHSGYFSVDEMAEGTIMTTDRRKLDVRCVHKTFETYFQSLRKAGFAGLPDVRELGVTDELLKLDEEFFGPLRGVPLHLVFSMKKPRHIGVKRSVEIRWPGCHGGMTEEKLIVAADAVCSMQAYEAAVVLIRAGFTPDTVCKADLVSMNLDHVQTYADEIMNKLCSSEGTGAVISCSLFDNLDAICDDETMKMMYFIIAFCMGSVCKERRALWDVYDKQLSTDDEDVLFSVTNEKATFHTDGSRETSFRISLGCFAYNKRKRGVN